MQDFHLYDIPVEKKYQTPRRYDMKVMLYGVIALLSCWFPLIPVVCGMVSVIYIIKYHHSASQNGKTLVMIGTITAILGLAIGTCMTMYYGIEFFMNYSWIYQDRPALPQPNATPKETMPTGTDVTNSIPDFHNNGISAVKFLFL